MIRHAIPYVAPGTSCCCPAKACGGIIPAPDCPEHGAKREPAMSWHEADSDRCRALRPARRYRCASGHFLPATFRPSGPPDELDDTCTCKPRT